VFAVSRCIRSHLFFIARKNDAAVLFEGKDSFGLAAGLFNAMCLHWVGTGLYNGLKGSTVSLE
jgi:hypothetical protein